MSIPDDLQFDDDEELEMFADFVDIAQQEQISEGDISVSETVDGKKRLPGILGDEDEDIEELLDEQGMHIMDEDEFETLEDPYDEDGYLEDEDDDDEDFDADEDWDDEDLEDVEDIY